MVYSESDIQRFRAKAGAPQDVPGSPKRGCRRWLGTKARNGYGRFHRNGSMVSAARFAYELAYGEIPAGLQIDHLCRVRDCVEPQHLEPVTGSENVRRGLTPGLLRAKYAAITHCPQGHAYTAGNVYRRENRRWLGSRGLYHSRECRACTLERNRLRERRGETRRLRITRLVNAGQLSFAGVE